MNAGSGRSPTEACGLGNYRLLVIAVGQFVSIAARLIGLRTPIVLAGLSLPLPTFRLALLALTGLALTLVLLIMTSLPALTPLTWLLPGLAFLLSLACPDVVLALTLALICLVLFH
jgi:hypothetical protein